MIVRVLARFSVPHCHECKAWERNDWHKLDYSHASSFCNPAALSDSAFGSHKTLFVWRPTRSTTSIKPTRI
jgi:hypothetical protein